MKSSAGQTRHWVGGSALPSKFPTVWPARYRIATLRLICCGTLLLPGPWGWPRSKVQARVPARRLPLSTGRERLYANRVNFQLRNATRAGELVMTRPKPPIPINKLSTSGIDEHWHKCADEARSVADDMKDEISKQMMLQIG